MGNSAKLYGSIQLHALARANVRRAEHDSLDAIAAVVFSALALESTVNKLLDIVAVHGDSISPGVAERYLAATTAGFDERSKFERKLRVLKGVLVATEPSIDLTTQWRLLFDIRNFVVHTKSELREQTKSGDWPTNDIVRRLVKLGVISEKSRGGIAATINEFQSYNVARWAHQTMGFSSTASQMVSSSISG